MSKWFRDNLRWIVALAASVIAAFLFFTITNNDQFEDFMELVLALAVGGTISATASFSVAQVDRDKKSGMGRRVGSPFFLSKPRTFCMSVHNLLRTALAVRAADLWFVLMPSGQPRRPPGQRNTLTRSRGQGWWIRLRMDG